MHSSPTVLSSPFMTSKKEIWSNSKHQDVEETYESTSKGKYLLITIKTDYRKALTETNDIIKYIYPERTNTNYNMYNQNSNIPIIHTNVSTYAQAFMTFHKFNPVL